jgi:phenylacetate-CoA ligase
MLATIRRGASTLLLGLDRATSGAAGFFRRHEWDTPEQVATIQQARLLALLAHAGTHVPYYRQVFRNAGLGDGGPGCVLESFQKLPLLDKATVRNSFTALQSDDIGRRHCIENWSGGTTGEPLAFMQQPDEVRVTGGAVLRWFYGWHGIRPGDREVRLWGSDRDLFRGKPPLKSSFSEAAKGLKLLNTFRMNAGRIPELVAELNEHRPALVRGYSSSLFEIAQYALSNGLLIVPPRVVISSAGTLYPAMRERIEAAFGCPVYNHYGTREMHNVAMECHARTGLHVSAFTHLVEVVDEQGNPCPRGTEGELVITSLLNYAMPLIRYRIGDRGALSESPCRCGRGLPVLSHIGGRTVEAFRTRSGSIVLGEFFIYLFEVIMKGGAFAKVQVVQRDYDLVEVRAVLLPGQELSEGVKEEVRYRTKVAMGEDCRVKFTVMEDIPVSASGKYSYTLCQIPAQAEARPAAGAQ